MNSLNSSIEFSLNGQPQRVPAGVTVAAALYLAGSGITRISVSGEQRAAFCGMGICQECRVLINGQRRLACGIRRSIELRLQLCLSVGEILKDLGLW